MYEDYEDYEDYDDYYGEYEDDYDYEMSSGRYKKNPPASTGAGYGGDTGDTKKRKAGIKQAEKRETKVWKNWQAELNKFLNKNHETKGENASDILNTLKQVLRCQAPDWWWKQPQRNMYITALQVCVILSQHYPKEWGDPDDDESAMAAMEELAQTCKLLVKQLEKKGDDNNKPQAGEGASGLLASASSWLASKISPENKENSGASHWLTQQLKTTSRATNDEDPSLPSAVLKIRDEAAAAVKAVLDAPECSMMGSHDYYRQKLRPLAFETVETFENPTHYYSPGGGYSNSVANYYIPYHAQKKGAKKKDDNGMKSSAAVLWKELSTYPTALPIEYGSSIFVRALENEMDKLRVLIIGPEDTPYANGCFIFDVDMGNDYPNAPPKVQLLTTSSFLSASDRRVRFNPNLYECGKVCLSLLGTWSGPGWQPKESTLLQVLVSLQSLILGTAEPYFNEPGYDGTQGTPHGQAASERYNKNIRTYTLRVAILPFLQNQLRDGGNTKKRAVGRRGKDPPGEDATNTTHFVEFQDVIKQHFKLKKKALQNQLYDWLQKDNSLQNLYSEFWSVTDQLEEEARLQGAVSSGTARRQAKRAKVDAPAVKMKDGVILLDDDDDDDGLQQALANSLATDGSAAKQPKESDEGVIELADSDDEGMNRKPAARAKAVHKSMDADAKDEKEAPAKEGSAGDDDVVDLT